MTKTELEKVLGIESITEDTACIEEVLKVIAELSEEKWRALDKKIKKWYDSAADAYNEGTLDKVSSLLELLEGEKEKTTVKKTTKKVETAKKVKVGVLDEDEVLDSLKLLLKTGETVEGDLIEETNKCYILLVEAEELVVMKSKVEKILEDTDENTGELVKEEEGVPLEDLEEDDKIEVFVEDESYYGVFVALTSKSLIITVQDDEKIIPLKNVDKVTYHVEEKKEVEKTTAKRKEDYVRKVKSKQKKDKTDKQHKMNKEIEKGETSKKMKVVKKEVKKATDTVQRKKPAGLRVKEIFIDNPEFDKVELLNALRDEGFILSIGTLGVIYTEFKQTVTAFASKGMIEDVWNQ